jgi:S-layer homology domain
MRTKAIQVGIVLAALYALAIGLASISANASAPASAPTRSAWASIQQPPGAHTAKAPYAADCDPDWTVVPSPIMDGDSGTLNEVAAISSSDVWAVGSYDSMPANRTLTVHWDGAEWSMVPSPNVGPGDHDLHGLAVISSNDVWAVGNKYGSVQALIMHWDGLEWSVVPGPDLGTYNTNLNAVAAASSNDVWAVGSKDLNSGPAQPLIMHWDGTEWSVVPGPNVGAGASFLYDVTVVSSSDVWAVGSYFPELAFASRTLIMHWDGSTWAVVPSPNVSNAENRLNAVAALASNDVWAVGNYIRNDAIRQTLTMHWDGNAWTVVPSPDIHGGWLNDVAVVSASEAWAVGFYGSLPADRTLIMHWDGAEWNVVPSPNVSTLNNLYGVAAVSSTDAWAVGVHNLSGDGGTLIERYNPISPIPCVASPTPTPTPEPPRCPGEHFTDVCPTDYFYQHVLDLNNLGIISGYDTAPPCDSPAHIPCFKPYNWTTRGQIAKVISLAAGFNEPVDEQTFEDVSPGHTFYEYIERMASRNIINGYPCGGDAEPCGPENRPYFRPGNTLGRGQLSKMAALAFDFNEPVTTQTFEDVLTAHTFYEHIERLASRSIINGYPCGDLGEPCVPPLNRPYFRPGNNITRGQIAKIVNLARIQATPIATPGATYTYTPSPNSPTTTPTGTATPEATSTTGISSD